MPYSIQLQALQDIHSTLFITAQFISAPSESNIKSDIKELIKVSSGLEILIRFTLTSLTRGWCYFALFADYYHHKYVYYNYNHLDFT